VSTSLGALLRAQQAEADAAAHREAEAPAEASSPPTKPTPPRDPALPRPSDTLHGDDRAAYYAAMNGVRPLRPRAAPAPRAKLAPKRVPVPRISPEDREARRRLAALVGEAIPFDVEVGEDGVRGLRRGAPSSLLREIGRRGVPVEGTLDLHGYRGEEAEIAVVRFLRKAHRQGLRRLRVVHGKGKHSAGGLGVLEDRVVDCLSRGGAAPITLAFTTAAADLGGRGALVVQLSKR
jgi:DNA-nicking Smr family endonuclease